jgi:uncharacterized protein
MTAKSSVDSFLSQRRLAVVGVGRKGAGFGYAVWRALRKKGYDAVPVNPGASSIDGVPCYASLRDIPEAVGGAVVVLPPKVAESVVEDAAAAGIRSLWLQQGASSEEAVRRCRERGIDVVDGECILMFADPGGIHKFHRWIWSALGKLPQ